MAGVAAAARAAKSGAQVAVVQKGPGLGGSAALSAGILWTAPDLRTLRRIVPRGDRGEGAKGVQMAELGLRSSRERRWLDVPEVR